ncbi:MAG TPA: hypothetical protein VJ436_00070 [Anaerolineales bacterium]|nr:hypothetical protein [Anaerolineales bacterium]
MIKACYRLVHILIWLSLALAACTNPIPQATALPATAEPSPTNQATLLPTDPPVPSPTQETPLVVLVASLENSIPGVKDLQDALAELAATDGFEFQAHPALAPEQLTPAVKVVIALPPDPGMAALAAAAPQTSFLAIGIPGLTAGKNLTSIDLEGAGADRQGFLAGYIAAITTPEWRVGALTASDTPAGVAARQGFLNGVVFYCGLCRQTFPPYYTYPMYIELPSSASPEEWQSAADTLMNQAVQTVYLGPGAGDASLLAHLAQAGIHLIGAAPPEIGGRDHWIATIQADYMPAIRQAWPDLLTGKEGFQVSATLEISDINPALLSPGRQLRVNEFLDDLKAGFIDTGVENNLP